MADAMKRGVKLRLDLSAWWFDCPECGEYLTFVLDGFHLAVDEARREREASREPTA
jgi:hypothetical protein